MNFDSAIYIFIPIQSLLKKSSAFKKPLKFIKFCYFKGIVATRLKLVYSNRDSRFEGRNLNCKLQLPVQPLQFVVYNYR